MRRVYSELVPLGRLVESPALDQLTQRSIQLLAAVRPGQESDAKRLVVRARAIGLSIGLWPMLEDHRGRWLNQDNAADFSGFICRLLDAVPPVDTVVLDLEPPIRTVRALLDWKPLRRPAGDRRPAERLGAPRARRTPSEATSHQEIVRTLRERGVESFAAVLPFALFTGRAGRGWQRALGTPVDGIPYDVVSPMLYTSLFAGYGRGVIRRRDALGLLDLWAREAVARFGSRTGVSVGAVGPGALGDERPLGGPDELAEDVRTVCGVGCGDVTLFDLGGVLSREPTRAWWDALTTPPPSGSDPLAPTSAPPGGTLSTRRASALDAAARAAGIVLDAVALRGR